MFWHPSAVSAMMACFVMPIGPSDPASAQTIRGFHGMGRANIRRAHNRREFGFAELMVAAQQQQPRLPVRPP